MRMMKNIFKVILMLSMTFSFLSCNEKNQEKKQDKKQKVETENQNLPIKLRKLDNNSLNFLEGKSVVLILGNDFSKKEQNSEILKNLDLAFGIESKEKKGLIFPLVHPDDFNKKFTNLDEKIENKDICGMIILGVPEKTYKQLSVLQDDKKLTYPVFSFFNQDEDLGIESTSTFVLDYNQKNENATYDINSILANAIQIIITNQKPFSNQDLLPTVQKIVGTEHQISKYVDTKTGIKSMNHFIFE